MVPMRAASMGWAALAAACLAGCAHEPTFPAEASKGFDPHEQIGIFNPEADTYLAGRVVQLGGVILRAAPSEEGTLITAQELPLKGSPPRPADEVKPSGQFVILYRGRIDVGGLQRGNKFALIGELKGTQPIEDGEANKAVPFLHARCLHVWKTGGYAIGDFPNLADGYYPLAEETYCVASR